MNLTDIAQHFSDSDAARVFLENKRWPDGVICPFCGLLGDAYRLLPKAGSKTPVRPGVWKCAGCRKQFTVTVGTIFEDSHIPLNKWLMAVHLICASKKGMSAHQLHRMLGVTYKAAWFMVHRLRYAMTQDSAFVPFTGPVEIDETYIGGKQRPTKPRKPGQHGPERGVSPTANKQAVVSLVERGGNVRSVHVRRVTGENLRPIIDETIKPNAVVITDSSTVFGGMFADRVHHQVNHTQDEYVRREHGLVITTNSVEGFFSLLKRGITGIYHHVGEQHLHRYLSEFDFRFNTRKITDGERSIKLIQKTAGKRLMYRRVVPKVD